MSFSSSGVTTMKMMRSTSTTSTSGVMLISELGLPAGLRWSLRAMSDLLVLDLLDAQADALRSGLARDLHHLADVAVGEALVALEEDLPARLGGELLSQSVSERVFGELIALDEGLLL